MWSLHDPETEAPPPAAALRAGDPGNGSSRLLPGEGEQLSSLGVLLLLLLLPPGVLQPEGSSLLPLAVAAEVAVAAGRFFFLRFSGSMERWSNLAAAKAELDRLKEEEEEKELPMRPALLLLMSPLALKPDEAEELGKKEKEEASVDLNKSLQSDMARDLNNEDETKPS